MKKENNKGILSFVERVGNKIPHTFILFLILMIAVGILSAVLSLVGVSVINPTDGSEIVVNNIFSKEGLSWALVNVIPNFVNFAPLGLILSMTLGIGMAEDVGLMETFMKKTIIGAPDKIVVFMVFLIGVCGNIASDAAIIIIPPLAAIIFMYLGKNPIAGIAAGYAAANAGFSANLVIAGTDALVTGVTNEAVKITGAPEIEITSNWYFMIVSTFLVAIVGTLINNYIIEPRVGTYEDAHLFDAEDSKVTEEESKALKNAGIVALVYIVGLVALAYPQGSFLRNPETGSILVQSVLIKGIIPLLLFFFIAVATAYGKSIGAIKEAADVPRLMEQAIKKMSNFIVLAFIIGQFIAWFNWSNIGLYISISMADILERTNMIGIPLFISFILISTIVNMFIGSASAKWSILAPIFVPMFHLLGYHPSWTQVLYRIGDSCTNVASPLNTYQPIILTYLQDYDEEAGMGTLISLMLPYTVILLITWTGLAMVWYLLDLPLGIGGQIYL